MEKIVDTQEPISFLELLGFSDSTLQEYTIRLNQSNENWFDVTNTYYSNNQQLMDWVFTKTWANDAKTKGKIPTNKVLQFIQLYKDEKPTIHWLFIGGFEIIGESLQANGNTLYEYKTIPQFKTLSGRSVVKYRKYRGDTQLINDLRNNDRRKRFISNLALDKITQSPISAQPFPGYLNIRLSFPELAAAVKNDEWRSALNSINAVYLQTDTLTGWHYVGSAYSRKGGTHGLLSRWEEYVSGDHTGKNKQLQQLVKSKGKEYIEDNFQYSILEIFDSRISIKDIIRREHWWMTTLSSVYDPEGNPENCHGYNTKLEWNRTAEGKPADKA